MKVAVYLRVSTNEQTTDNQIPDVERFLADNHMTDIVYFRENDSAWKDGHQAELRRFMEPLRRGFVKYDALVVWSLDRLTRGGALPTLQIVHSLKGYGCRVLSVREPWLNVDGPLADVLYAIVGWIAKMESDRKSERVKAGHERARKEGKHLGRPMGKKDSTPRRKSGYYLRYANKQIDRSE